MENLNNQIQIKELIQDLSHIGGYVQQLEQKILSLEWDVMHLTEENRELKESKPKKTIKVYEHDSCSFLENELRLLISFNSLISELEDEIELRVDEFGNSCSIQASLDNYKSEEIIERCFKEFIEEICERNEILISEKNTDDDNLDSDIVELERGEL